MNSAKARLGEICLGAGTLLCLAGIVAVCLHLHQGTAGQRLLVAVAILFCVVLGLGLLKKEGVVVRHLVMLACPIALAMLMRCFLLDYQSGDYNIFLSQWYEVIRQGGGFSALSQPIGNYNVPYLYFIAAISYLDMPALYMYKLFSIFMEIILAWGGLRLVRALIGERRPSMAPLIAFVLLLFLPTVVLNGSYWGQCDVIYGAFVVHAVACVLEGKNKHSLVYLALAFSFKLQTVFIMPLWGVLWLAKRMKFWDLMVFPGVYLLTTVPALLLGKPMTDILGVYVGQVGDSEILSLNAPSIYQLIPSGATYDQALLANLGIVAAAALSLTVLVIGVWRRKKLTNQHIMAISMVLVVGIPFFLPHMHERYFFLADVLAVCWAVANIRRSLVAVLVCASSLASYLIYFRMKYNFVIYFHGNYMVMFWETVAMLLAFVLCVHYLISMCRGEK